MQFPQTLLSMALENKGWVYQQLVARAAGGTLYVARTASQSCNGKRAVRCKSSMQVL